MHSDKTQEKNRGGGGSGFPIQGTIALAVIVLGVVALILKAAGVF